MKRTMNRLAVLGVLAFVVQLASVARAEKVVPTSPVDLNTATEAQLESLKGVGAATAAKIIAGRPYKSVDELSSKGVPQRTVEMIRPLVTVGGAVAAAPVPPALPKAPAPTAVKAAATAVVPAAPKPPAAAPMTPPPSIPSAGVAGKAAVTKLAPGQKVNINTASETELEALPGIGPAKAQKIIAARPFAAPEDIMKVSGIKQGIFAKIKDLITVN